MSPQEQNILDKRINGLNWRIVISGLVFTITTVWGLSAMYYGLKEEIRNSTRAYQAQDERNATQDVRITNIETRLDNDEASIRALTQNIKQ